MRILVTGGAGFIGSAVCRLLVGELNATVLNVDKLTYAANLTSLHAIESNPRYAFRRADICKRTTMTRLLREFDPDAVLHLAAELHVDRSIDGPADFIRTNVEGTFVLLRRRSPIGERLPAERAKRVSAFTTSRRTKSSARSARGQIHRKDALSAELALLGDRRRPPIIWCGPGATPSGCRRDQNCSNNYGPYHFPEKLIPLAILKALARQADAGLRRRPEHARLALRRGPRPRSVMILSGAGRRELQCRRRMPSGPTCGRRSRSADCSTKSLPDLPHRPHEQLIPSSPTGRATTGATRWTSPRSGRSWTGYPAKTSTAVCVRRSLGIAG